LAASQAVALQEPVSVQVSVSALVQVRGKAPIEAWAPGHLALGSAPDLVRRLGLSSARPALALRALPPERKWLEQSSQEQRPQGREPPASGLPAVE
jgi:hypothetical protein